MIGYTHLLLEEHDRLDLEVQTECLRAIAQSGQRMINIVNELLLLAGLRDVSVKMQPVDIKATVKESLDRLAYLFEEYEAEAVVAENWPPAMGYGPWLEEVWANYISNAIKYGGRPPLVELGATVQGDGWVRCWTRDNGAGLTPDEQARLFTPFTRLKQVSVKGHGLGLSIVRRIVEKMGGEVSVESEVGEGSVFGFTLPGVSE
jgi:signal transduction histidine kinase